LTPTFDVFSALTRICRMRNYAELAMQRVKRIFGNTMKARKLPQQKAEAWASAVALNRMTSFASFMIYSTKPYRT
jgi:hypothetical protein